MIIGRSAYWALKAVVHLAAAGASQVPQTAPSVAVAIGAPAPGTARLLHRLALHGLLISFRGSGGGFILARDPADVTALDVYRAVLGEIPSHPDDNDKGTPHPTDGVERLVDTLDRNVRQRLRSTTIADLMGSNAIAPGAPRP